MVAPIDNIDNTLRYIMIEVNTICRGGDRTGHVSVSGGMDLATADPRIRGNPLFGSPTVAGKLGVCGEVPSVNLPWLPVVRVEWQFLPFDGSQWFNSLRSLPMQSMNISLPEPLKEFVDGQIAAGRYSSASEYVRELIRADERRKAEERLEALLLEGLQSAETELTPTDWSDIRQEAIAQVKARKKAR
jgi:antitoxin ParD1/3/4